MFCPTNCAETTGYLHAKVWSWTTSQTIYKNFKINNIPKCKNYSYKILRHKWALPILFCFQPLCPYHLLSSSTTHISLSSTNLTLGALRSGIVIFFTMIYFLSPGLTTQQTVWTTEWMNVYAAVETNSLSWESQTPSMSMICQHTRFIQ